MSSLAFDWTMGSMPYGPEWRGIRKAFMTYFHHEAAKVFEPLEVTAVHSYLHDLLDSPEEFRQHTKQYVFHPLAYARPISHIIKFNWEDYPPCCVRDRYTPS
jgi:cytochrome P450